nr:hypothetical protein [uncultured Pseudomonas sp.]
MDWLPVLRELHLYGGGRVLNGMDQKADLRPNALSGKSASLNIKSFGSFYGDIKRLGLQIVGCDFFHTEDQAKSFAPPRVEVHQPNGVSTVALYRSRAQLVLYSKCRVYTKRWPVLRYSFSYFPPDKSL